MYSDEDVYMALCISIERDKTVGGGIYIYTALMNIEFQICLQEVCEIEIRRKEGSESIEEEEEEECVKRVVQQQQYHQFMALDLHPTSHRPNRNRLFFSYK